MGYRYSDVDRRNVRWFKNDPSCQSLFGIHIFRGEIRGLKNISVKFNYPITAIAGRNGTGKTTLLALAACAFHNRSDGFKLPDRQSSYYTFSDFFIQADGERNVEDIAIGYDIFHNGWRVTSSNPDRTRIGHQIRKKNASGRWNNYDSRVHRTVVYLGINRIVPHSEKSASKSYRKLFRSGTAQGWEDTVKAIGARIFDKDYTLLEVRRYRKYSLLVLSRNECTYSGFNMGAGEDSTFEMISTIMQCPRGTLLVVDEIELGLHEEAQIQLIRELKQLCLERHIQIICTTHSPQILKTLPPEGRLFLEGEPNSVIVIPEVSSRYATGRLRGKHTNELDVLVEDGVAKKILEAILNHGLRERINIIPIGSSTAVMRHLCTRFRESKYVRESIANKEIGTETFAVLDGDKLISKETHIKLYCESLETDILRQEGKEWIEDKLYFLPGGTWPESWVLDNIDKQAIEKLSLEFGTTPERLDDILQRAKRSGKHNEFYSFSNSLALSKEYVTQLLIREAVNKSKGFSDSILHAINAALVENF